MAAVPKRARRADAPVLSAQIAASHEAMSDPPKGADVLLSLTAVPYRLRAEFWTAVETVDFGALDGFTTDGADPMKAGAELFRTWAAMESALSVVARPGGEPFDDFAARELDPYGLIGLFVWYFEAMTPGEAQPSLT